MHSQTAGIYLPGAPELALPAVDPHPNLLPYLPGELLIAVCEWLARDYAGRRATRCGLPPAARGSQLGVHAATSGKR